jgi:hypothetical protein
MIKLNGKRTVRETTAEFQTTDEESGELTFETIRVRYFSPRISDFKKLRADFEKKQEGTDTPQPYFLSEGLAMQLESLPDLGDAKGKPLQITAAVLEESIDLLNLQAIRDAIDEDIEAGKSKPGESRTGTTRSA